MREADDDALRRARVFLDIRGDAMENIGEIADPLARDEEITLFKKGGGGHLDLMASDYILKVCRAT